MTVSEIGSKPRIAGGARPILLGALAGALGGAIGWLPGELLAIPQPDNALWRYGLIAAYFVAVGGCIGAAIGALDGVVNRSTKRALAGGATGAILGMLGGALGSLPGEFAFQAMSALGLGVVGRAFGWGIVGLFIGMAQGVAARDRARLVRGALGGFLGGYLGGGMFETVSLVISGGAASRWIAVVLLGAFIGALVAFFQTWLAEARLTIVSSGSQEGVRYDLSKPRTILGRGDRDDFVLYAGEGVAAAHAAITQKPDGYWIAPLQPEHSVRVEQQVVQGERKLRPGNLISLGALTLRFSERTIRCPECGKENPISARFCLGCGAALGHTQ